MSRVCVREIRSRYQLQKANNPRSGWQSVAWGVSPRIKRNLFLNPRSGWQSTVPLFCHPLRGFYTEAMHEPGAYAPGYRLSLLRSWNSELAASYFTESATLLAKGNVLSNWMNLIS